MNIRIVTDSSCDLSPDLAEQLGVLVVPLYVRFGDEMYRERVTISDEEFYEKLLEGTVHPVTIQPGPNDFGEVYHKIAQEADGIVSIHISSKLSGTINSALLAKDIVKTDCPIEVVDSRTVSVALGLITITTAQAARQGKELQQVLEVAEDAIDNTHTLCLLDTLRYLQLGGRIGKAKALLGTMLNIKPLITVKDGEVVPSGQVRSRVKGIEQLVNFVRGAAKVEDLAIGYSTTFDDAISLSQRLNSLLVKPKARVFRLGTTLGVHGGPGTLIVSLRGKMLDEKQDTE